MLISAFDPGQKAAAALLRRDISKQGRLETVFLDMVDLPMLPDGETRKQLDVAFLGRLLERWDPDIAIVENVQVAVHGRNGDGFRQSSMSPSDAFRFGLACGMIRAVILAYEIPVELVHPRTWTGHFRLKGGDKKPHIEMIKKIAPSCRPFITLAKHDGRADAGLMALWYAEKTGMM